MENNSLITLSIDQLTIKSNTIYDQAKLRLYLDHCRQLKKKAEFDEFDVSEEALRTAI